MSPTDVTTTGRPPFDGTQTTCYLSQFNNAIYALDADKSDTSAVYIYNVAGKSWSKQEVNPGGPDPTSLVTILDHDSNVFYALDNGVMWFLNMESEVVANTTALSWIQVGNPSFDTTGYKPTMALAENHVHFIGVPGASAGDAFIFVIHFSFFQPTVQSYPAASGSTFPSTHGQTASFFLESGVQTQFAFIPDDGSGTFVVDVVNNATIPLSAPTDKSSSTFAASITALVQLTEDGNIFWLPYTPGNTAESQAASWSKLNVQGLSLPSSSNSTSNGTSASTSTGTGSHTGTGSSTASGSSATGTSGSSGSNSALAVNVGMGMVTFIGSLLLGALAI